MAKFSAKYKLAAVHRYLQAIIVIVRLGLPSLKKETKKTETQKPTPAEGTVEALQTKVERLEMEIAYLKKLNALVQMHGIKRSVSGGYSLYEISVFETQN